jgi:acyl-CoA thioester hydrolase
MFTEIITPRFAETDALGHINNTVIPTWLEQARTPVFRWFVPDLNPQNWCLIIAKIEVEFRHEILYGHEVRVETYVAKVGNSSFRVGQRVYQQDQLCAQGSSVLVHFDYATKQSKPIPADIRRKMEAHQHDDVAQGQ